LSVQEQKRRQRRREKTGKFKLRVRYKNHIYTTIETEDYGSFKQMYEKYKGKYEFWCGDQPPVKEHTEGTYNGYRLDSDVVPEHTIATLKSYGRHKCWIDPTYKVDGKKVCLVFNATFRTNRETRKAYPITSKLKLYYQVYVVFHDEESGKDWEQEYGTAESSIERANDTIAKAKEDYPTSKVTVRHLYLETSY